MQAQPMNPVAIELQDEAFALMAKAVEKMFACYDLAPLLNDWSKLDRDSSATLAVMFAAMDESVRVLIERHGPLDTIVIASITEGFVERVVTVTNAAPAVTRQ